MLSREVALWGMSAKEPTGSAAPLQGGLRRKHKPAMRAREASSPAFEPQVISQV
jgi:hypothetical protein